ncbi:MAG: 4'-phosphopantetheinyl transferase family protein [Rhodanobacteraceae bacterium]
MSTDLAFEVASPESAAARLDAEAIHLWRIPYVASQRRTPLLELLGAYLGKPASEVTLAENHHGKPSLTEVHGNPASAPSLEFNWSHSGDYALIALSRATPLGVDIERLDKKLRVVEIARRFFDQGEAEVVASLTPPTREHAFIALWCAKEAVLKAAGEGLSFGLARLAFERRAEFDWQPAHLDAALGRADEWRLIGFAAAAGYRGALAWRGGSRTIAAFRLPGAELR